MICNKLKECYKNEGYICNNKHICIVQRDTRLNVKCEENKKRYNLVNSKKLIVAVYRMDGGLIADEDNICKCDYLYGIKDDVNPTAIFIELKGKDIPHALEQVKHSVSSYSMCFKEHRIYARIICKSVPRNFNDPSILNFKKELRRKYQGNLVIHENNLDEDYLKL